MRPWSGTSFVTTEPDEAGKLMMALNLDQAAKDMSGAIDRLLADDAAPPVHISSGITWS